MIQFKHTITDPNGLHARNALLLSREISGYTSVVEVQCGSKWASGRQVMALMGLGARCGEEVQFFVDGQDEATAATAKKTQARFLTVRKRACCINARLYGILNIKQNVAVRGCDCNF